MARAERRREGRRRGAWVQPAPLPANARRFWKARRSIDFMDRYCIPGKGLRPFQRRFVRSVYVVDQRDRPLIIRAVNSMARKNGKSTLTAAMHLDQLGGPAADGCYGRINAAVAGGNVDQAGIIFDMLADMIRRDRMLRRQFSVYPGKMRILYAKNKNRLQVMSTNFKAGHGWRLGFWSYDELAYARDMRLYRALDGSGGTIDPATGVVAPNLGIVISTWSDEPGNPLEQLVTMIQDGHAAGEMRDHHLTLHRGEIVNERGAALPVREVFSLRNAARANPGLGTIISKAEIRSQFQKGKRSPSQRRHVETTVLNRGDSGAARMVDINEWHGCRDESLRLEQFHGKRVVLGLDLSRAVDLSALAFWFPDHDALFCDAWVPGEGLRDREQFENREYTRWAREGQILTCPGRTIDLRMILDRVAWARKKFKVLELRYDRWSMKSFAIMAAAMKTRLPPMREFGQGTRDMGPAIDELERRVLNGTIRHPGNEVLNSCVANCTVVTNKWDVQERRKPAKRTERARIDCAAAALMALAPPEEKWAEPLTADRLVPPIYGDGQ